MTHVAVIDIGKTNAKLALVDTGTMAELAVITRPNTVLPGPPWPHFDVDGHWDFLLDGLAAFHMAQGIDAISITTHGACAVLLDDAGSLAAPVLDYEHTGPDEVAAEYDTLRPDFAETGSPRLPMGLNIGAQLHWMFTVDPALRGRTRTILTYPQYWAHRLTGVAASDVSSLGCHTDLWAPQSGAFSSLVDRLGIRDKMAPARPASDVLGPILPELAARTGLAAGTPVLCGIHDSNASLYPHLLARTAPFSVVSTGTWVIAMAVGGPDVTLDPSQDTLINVGATGVPVPSARFMGGREFETVVAGQFAEPTEAEIAEVLRGGLMLMPAVVPESGPFPGQAAAWIGAEPRLGSGARIAAVSAYLAMMTATCLDLIGAQGEIVVEGPFARNEVYCRMLAAATDRPVIRTGNATGTSHGAALLAVGSESMPLAAADEVLGAPSSDMRDYAEVWRATVASGA